MAQGDSWIAPTDISGLGNKTDGATGATGQLSASEFNTVIGAIGEVQNDVIYLRANKLDAVTEGDLDEIFPLT